MVGAGPVTEVVIGAATTAAVEQFLGLFGLEPVDRPHLDQPAAAQLGLGPPTGAAVRLATPQAPSGTATVLVVPTGVDGAPPMGWAHGPRALDIYTTDLDASVAEVRDAGHEVSPEAVLAGGPMRMRQALVTGPEGLPVVLVESTHRRSSICDGADAPRHSELHSVVWCVEDHESELQRWSAAGWTAGATISFSEPSVSAELGLPESPTPITMTMLSDAEVTPTRLELMTFDDHRGSPPGSNGAVAGGGIMALVMGADDLDASVAAWGSGARFAGEAHTTQGARSRVGTTLGGIRIVLVERG